MKRTNLFLIIVLWAVMAGLAGCTQSGNQNDDLITVDVTKSYPQKELILQDFMDVEYIPLETTDEFITTGWVRVVGKDHIVVINDQREGNIFIFDRKGKGLRKFNHKGGGGVEYVSYTGLFLDENNDELFVFDTNKILVYDLYGIFKRSFKLDIGVRYGDIYNFDNENFICRDMTISQETADQPQYYIISKQDGSIVREIKIPIKQFKRPNVRPTGISRGASNFHSVIPSYDNWILFVPSSDSLFLYRPDHQITPFIARTPSVHSMDPEVFLFPIILSAQSYLMQIVKNDEERANTRIEFPRKDLMYVKQEKAIYETTVYNGDFSNKRAIDISMKSIITNEIGFMQNLNAFELVEAYKEGQLKGKLKEIAEKLDEEDNPVIMIAKYKK